MFHKKYEDFPNEMLKKDVLDLINFYFNFEVTLFGEADCSSFDFSKLIRISSEFSLNFHSGFGLQLRSSLFMSMA